MGEGDYEGCCGGCCATFFLWLVGELVVEQIWGLGNVYVWVTIACVVGLLGCIIFPFVAKFIADRRASQRQKQVNYVLEQQAYAQEQEAYVRWQEADARGRAAAWETAKINEWKRSGMGKAVTDRAVPAPDPVHLAVAKATQPGGAGQAEVRQALVENLSELVRAIGLEAAELVSRLAALPDNGCAAGLFRTHIIGYETWSPAQNGARLTAEAADIVLEVFAWSTSRSRLLAGVHPVAAKMLSGPLAPLDARLHALVKRRARFDHRGSLVNDSDDVFLGDGRGPEPCLPPEEWPEFVRDLLRVLSGVRDGLATVAAPAPLPVLSPPGFARLRVEVAAETVTQGLETFLRRTNGLLQAATAGPRPSELDRHWVLDDGLLRNFLTIDVLDRFQRATAGFFHVAALSEHDITRDSQSVFYLVYVEIAAAYLKEVLDLMPEYTKASGQGEQRDPVNIQGMFLGPVGNVGGSVTGSSVTVGEQVTVNGATVATTATVDSQVALKLIDLAAAIQSDPGVDADDRPDLLIDVQDIAHAEAAPEDRDRFRRAKRALMAITAAASTAQQVEGVLLEGHDVFSKYR